MENRNLINKISDLIKEEYEKYNSLRDIAVDEYMSIISNSIDEFYSNELSDSVTIDTLVDVISSNLTESSKKVQYKIKFLKDIESYLKSGNDVPITRVNLKAEELAQLLLYAKGKIDIINDLKEKIDE